MWPTVGSEQCPSRTGWVIVPASPSGPPRPDRPTSPCRGSNTGPCITVCARASDPSAPLCRCSRPSCIHRTSSGCRFWTKPGKCRTSTSFGAPGWWKLSSSSRRASWEQAVCPLSRLLWGEKLIYNLGQLIKYDNFFAVFSTALIFRCGLGIRVSQIWQPLATDSPIETMGKGIFISKYEPLSSIHLPENSIWSFTTWAQYYDHD